MSASFELVLTYKRTTPLSKTFDSGYDLSKWYEQQNNRPKKKKKKEKETQTNSKDDKPIVSKS